MAQSVHLRKYGVQTTIDFEVYEIDGVDLRVDWVPAAADCEVMKDEGASTQCTNTATDEGSTYSIVLTATEMQAARLVLKIVDAATKAFLDKVVIIETYGNASAMHAFDLDTADQVVASVTGAVGSVTGAVGSVTGSVGSVTGAVGSVTGAVGSLTGHTNQTADHTAGIADIPTVAEFNARTLVAASYFDPAADTVATVTTLTNKTGFSLVSTGLDLVLVSSTFVAALIAGVWDRVLSGATHNIATSAGRRLRQIQDFGIYDMGSAWVDTVGGTSTGTTDGEDATVANRSTVFANAQTVAASVGLDAIHIQNGNSITLAATINGFNLWSGPPNQHGQWTLALGTQDIGTSAFSGATISGVGTGTTPHFDHCDFNATTVPPCTIESSSITGTLTLGSAGALRINNSWSGVAGAGSPVVDMGSGIGASTLEVTNWRRGFTLNNLAAGDVVTLDGVFGTITLNGADATVEIRGSYKALVNNLTGSPTVNIAGAFLAADVAAILVDTGTTLPATLSTIETDTTTDIPALIATAQADLDIITGADGVNLLSATQASIDAIEVDTGTTLDTKINTIDTLIDQLIVEIDTATGEPAQGAPGVSVKRGEKIDWLYKFLRNKAETIAGTISVYDDAGTTVDHKITHSDDGTTYTKGEVVTGP